MKTDNMSNVKKNSIIHYDPSLTGTGKTYGLLKSLTNEKKKAIIAVPSIALANEYKRIITDMVGITQSKLQYKVIHNEEKEDLSDMKTHEILKRYVDKINKGSGLLKVIITTHETLKRGMLNNVNGFEGWHLYIDECMELIYTSKISLTSLTAGMFIDNFCIQDIGHNKFYGLCLTDSSNETAKSVMKGSLKDSFYDNDFWCDLLNYLDSNNFSIMTLHSDYEKAKDLAKSKEKETSISINLLATANKKFLESFESITVLSALFEKTIMYRLFEVLEFDLVKKTYSLNEIDKHNNGERLRVHYAKKGRNTNLYKEKKPDENRKEDNEDIIVNTILKSIGSNKFIFNANIKSRTKQVYTKYQSDTCDPKKGQGALLTAVAGINDYQNYHSAVYTTARNLDDSQASVFSSFGIDRKTASDDRNLLSAYQFLSRTSIRDGQAEGIVNFYVIDEVTACFIAKLWPGSELIHIDVKELSVSDVPITELIKDKNDRKSYYRVTKKFRDGVRKFSKNSRERFTKICEDAKMIDNEAYKYIKKNYC